MLKLKQYLKTKLKEKLYHIMREEKHATKTDIDAKTETVPDNQFQKQIVAYIQREVVNKTENEVVPSVKK